MEQQTITITIKTKGDRCVMSDAEIRAWYLEHVSELFDPKFGTPEIEVTLRREEK